MKKNNLLTISACICMYVLNRSFRQCFAYPRVLGIFVYGYMNDILAGVLITAYLNLLLGIFFGERYLESLLLIEVFVLTCGIVWEYIGPVLQTLMVSDVLDLAAYMTGGLIYYLLQRRWINEKYPQIVITELMDY